MKKLLFAAFFISAYPAFSQLQKGYFFQYHLGYASQTVLDASLSPSSYSGSLGNLGLGFKRYGKNWIETLSLHGSSGVLSPDVNPQATGSVILVGARLDYQIGYLIFKENNAQIHVGLGNINAWDYRNVNQYTNNSFNYNGLITLGPYLSILKKFKALNQNFAVQYESTLGAMSYVLRPGFVRPATNGQSFGYQEFMFLGSFFHWQNKTELMWQISQENHLALGYRWEYFSIAEPNKIQLAQHYATLSLITKL